MVKLILRLCATIVLKVVVVLQEMMDYIKRVISPEVDVSEIKREELSKTLQQAIQEIQGKKKQHLNSDFQMPPIAPLPRIRYESVSSS